MKEAIRQDPLQFRWFKFHYWDLPNHHPAVCAYFTPK